MNKIHQIKRALILAAGRGTRLAPLTDDRPKPMVEVCGRPIITTILDALKAAGISSITIVRGYRGEAFDILRDQYEGISFLDNPDWETSNNISSITLAGERGLLEDTYVVEGDLYLASPAVVTPGQERSNYIAFPVTETDDWRFSVDAAGRITDGARLARCAAALYREERYRGLYWDEIALKYCAADFHIYVRPCTRADVWEIDTVEELRALERDMRHQ